MSNLGITMAIVHCYVSKMEQKNNGILLLDHLSVNQHYSSTDKAL